MFVGPRADTHHPKLQKFGADIQDLVSQSGSPQQVHFTGIVDDVESYLRAADISILASNREGTPNSVLEAMATGLPCVVTPFLGISEGIGRAGEHYLMAERNPDAIAQQLIRLLEDDATATALAQRGQQFVVQNLDQQRSLDHYAALYEELATIAEQRRR
jgi:glycosyltransferase involved in cell wall biosynthesis